MYVWLFGCFGISIHQRKRTVSTTQREVRIEMTWTLCPAAAFDSATSAVGSRPRCADRAFVRNTLVSEEAGCPSRSEARAATSIARASASPERPVSFMEDAANRLPRQTP